MSLVVGNKFFFTGFGPVVQWLERRSYKAIVPGSNPGGSTTQAGRAK